jgi:FtsP/CotA-like multicopper oxidase with cupredoxin domain
MKKCTYLRCTRLMLVATLALACAISLSYGQAPPQNEKNMKLRGGRLTTAEKKAAAKRAADLGLLPGVAGSNAKAAPLPAMNVKSRVVPKQGMTGIKALVVPTQGTVAAPLPGMDGPGGIPHYFGPYANWAFSPLPKGSIGSITVDNGGSGYRYPVVEISDAYGNGDGLATATIDPVTQINSIGAIIGITVTNPGSGYTAPIVTITGSSGADAAATAILALPWGVIDSITVDNGGSGYIAPVVQISDANGNGNGLATATIDPVTQIDSIGAITGITITSPGSGYTAPVVTITDPSGVNAAATATLIDLAGGIRKFVDKMPGLGVANKNSLGQYIPVAEPESVTLSGQAADYYVIAVVEYTEKLHTDLPPTRLRGYVQLGTATRPGTVPLTYIDGSPIHYPGTTTQIMALHKPHYLGPIIIAKGRVQGIANVNPGDPGYPKPVRIKFYNLLPVGAGGDLFIPVDESIPGAGLGPAGPGAAGSKYSQNRATVHLHGNNTVWISDGTVHQWITPAGENTPYPKGVSVRNVPDMKDSSGAVECDAPGSGCMTLFYTNAQSARLQWYHDHALGITRLNVYTGEAAGYVITDAVEQDMINGTNVSGVNPGLLKVLPDIGIPLIIQDKTFVDADTIYAQDPTWNSGTSGVSGTAVTGDLWYPHVYMTVQNPWDLTGTNAFGRWHYGPWFNPPVPECVNGGPVGCLEVGPVSNEYYQPICDGLPDFVNPQCTAPWEPPLRPGVPSPSIPGESFLDTPLVNGTAYPYLEVQPKPYRFRVLNASNDRMVNLQLYVAADKTTPTTPGAIGTVLCDGTTGVPVGNCTEVKMVPVGVAPANQYADTPSGIPDPATKGPDWIQIGTEGGFMPKPVVVPSQPIGYNLNPSFFNFSNVNQHSLYLGSAERVDVLVDFSKYAGKTLILYNDSPAPVPAGAAQYDFFTGNGNLMDGGGAPNTQPGYGPNTRTIMQIRVAAATAPLPPDILLANLNAVFAKTASKRGVFEVSQDPIIIPQAAFNSAYNNSFTATADQYVKVGDSAKTFRPIDQNGVMQPAITMPLELKAMHDEMGGVYDTMFGRMSGMLGTSLQNSPNHVLIPFGLASPPTDLVKGSMEATPVGSMPDGTQIWRIFHNGVDTHPVHVHLFTAQLINRIGQDGAWYNSSQVDPTDLGWKETFKVNPLEITYLAMRPTVPTPSQIPFEVPDSVRLIDPTLPEGATLIPPPPAGWFDPEGNAIGEILNHYVNFGWEYVWHCHILAHEEMDMMHSLVFVVPPDEPTGLRVALAGAANNPRVNLNWTDNSQKEAQFNIERATNAAFTTGLTTFNLPGTPTMGNVTFTDSSVARNTKYWYRVFAVGSAVGDTQVYPGSPNGFSTMSANSVSNIVSVQVGTTAPLPASSTNLTAIVQSGPQVSLTWRDNATNETGFVIERCTGAGCSIFASIATTGPRNNTGNVNYADATVAFGNRYSYRVYALNGTGQSIAPTNTVSAILPAILAAPTNFSVAVALASPISYRATLTWTAAANPASFTIQRATNAMFTSGLISVTAAGTARSVLQVLNRSTTYYYRILATNNAGGSSVWTNALPFPIRTGN